MKRIVLLATLLLGIGFLANSCTKDESSGTLAGIWESENGMNRIEFKDGFMTSNYPGEDGELERVPYTYEGNTIKFLGGLAWMTIDKLTSSELSFSDVASIFGDDAEDWIKKLHRVTGLDGYESKIEGKWEATKCIMFEGGEWMDITDDVKGATFTFSDGVLKSTYPGEGTMELDPYTLRAGAVVLDDSVVVLNIESISSSSLKVKVIEYDKRKEEFFDGIYETIEFKKVK